MAEGHLLWASWVAWSSRDSWGGKAKELQEDHVDKVRDSFFIFLDWDLGGGGNWKEPESEVDREMVNIETELWPICVILTNMQSLLGSDDPLDGPKPICTHRMTVCYWNWDSAIGIMSMVYVAWSISRGDRCKIEFDIMRTCSAFPGTSSTLTDGSCGEGEQKGWIRRQRRGRGPCMQEGWCNTHNIWHTR